MNKDPTFCTWEVREVFLCDNYLLECSTDGKKIIGYAMLSGARINLKPCHFPFISNTTSTSTSTSTTNTTKNNGNNNNYHDNKNMANNKTKNNNDNEREEYENKNNEFTTKYENKSNSVFSLSVPLNNTDMSKERSPMTSKEFSRVDLVRGVSISSSEGSEGGERGSEGGGEGGERGSGRPVWSTIGDAVRSASDDAVRSASDTTHDDWNSNSPSPTQSSSLSPSTSTSISSSFSTSIQPTDIDMKDKDKNENENDNNNNDNNNIMIKLINGMAKSPHLPSPTETNLNKKMVKKNSPKMGLKSLKSVFGNCDSPQYNRSMQFYTKHKNSINDNNMNINTNNNGILNTIINNKNNNFNNNNNDDNNEIKNKNNFNKNNKNNYDIDSENESMDNNCLGIQLSCLSNSSNKDNTPRSEFWIRFDEKKNLESLKNFIRNENNDVYNKKIQMNRYNDKMSNNSNSNENENENDDNDETEKEIFMDFRDKKTKSFPSSNPVLIPRNNTSSFSTSSSYTSPSTSSSSTATAITAVSSKKDEINNLKKNEIRGREKEKNYKNNQNFNVKNMNENENKNANNVYDDSENSKNSKIDAVVDIVEKNRMEKLLEILKFASSLTVESMYDFSSNEVVEEVERDRNRGSGDDGDNENMNTSSTSLLGKGSVVYTHSTFSFFLCYD